jgi:arylsulfatase A-like enzyme
MKQFRAAYYGSINHVSDQIQRVLDITPLDNTVILFTSDHGEMLGDHQWMQKSLPYEPSARVPFFIWFPPTAGVRGGQVRKEPVELMDVMPTLLDLAGAPIPETVDGASVMPLLRGDNIPWRKYIHGEYHDIPALASGMQYLTDGKRKYAWFPARDEEQFFDLEQDPREMRELSQDASRRDEVACWRSSLVRELAGRPEGFSDGKELKRLPGPTMPYLPGFEIDRSILRQ